MLNTQIGKEYFVSEDLHWS